MFNSNFDWLGNLAFPGFTPGAASGNAAMPIHHLVSGHPPQALPYKPEVKIVASRSGFQFKNPAGGQKLFAGLGADKARIEKGIKVAQATGVSAGSLQSVIQMNTHVKPEDAAKALLELIQELMSMDKGPSMYFKSRAPSDLLRLYLSGFTSVSPQYCYQRLIDKLGLTWKPGIRIVGCAVELDPANPGSLTPWTLTNYRHWMVVIDENSNMSLADALHISGAVPGVFVSPELGKSDRGHRVIGVDGAFINRIPNIAGDQPSIAMSYTRATKMPRELTDELPKEWAALFNPMNMFDPSYMTRVAAFWTKAAQYMHPVKQFGLLQNWIEIYNQMCGNNNVQMPGDFPIVLGLDDFAALNMGVTEEACWRMFEHGYQVGLKRYTEGLESGELVIPS